jgi:hypothetical protein
MVLLNRRSLLRDGKAREIGSRLPTFEDRPRFPFVDAICKEVKRWKPTVPLVELPPLSCLAYARMTGVPCTTAIGDVHEGFFVPKD